MFHVSFSIINEKANIISIIIIVTRKAHKQMAHKKAQNKWLTRKPTFSSALAVPYPISVL